MPGLFFCPKCVAPLREVTFDNLSQVAADLSLSPTELGSLHQRLSLGLEDRRAYLHECRRSTRARDRRNRAYSPASADPACHFRHGLEPFGQCADVRDFKESNLQAVRRMQSAALRSVPQSQRQPAHQRHLLKHSAHNTPTREPASQPQSGTPLDRQSERGSYRCAQFLEVIGEHAASTRPALGWFPHYCHLTFKDPRNRAHTLALPAILQPRQSCSHSRCEERESPRRFV